MPIRFHSSNRVEKLQQILCQQLSAVPLQNPLASEIVVVPTFAMSRWLNLRIAQQRGVAANIDYPLPAAWLWQLARQLNQDLPETDPLATEPLAWKTFGILPGLTGEAEFREIRRYLANDSGDIKRWQLSQRIAEVFDRYQQYRPDMIREWSAQKVSNWQAVLWRRLIQDIPGLHRVAIIDRLIAQLNNGEAVCGTAERVSLFTISALSPLSIEVLMALSAHTHIDFYQYSPTDHYFADLKSSRSLSKLSLTRPDEIRYYDTGNELLASWGRQAQTLQSLLLQQNCQPEQETEHYVPPGNSTLLHSIQQSIFDLGTTPVNPTADASIAIHVCHSPMRECQVLHDQLLNILNANPHLGAEDILVMVPEINRYAPYIEAVFGFEDNNNKPYLPWNLSDISLIDEHPLIQSFLQLLRLPTSRFEASEVLSLLEVDEIQHHFDLDETAIDDIHQWLKISQLRWGIDDEFKQAFGLPPTVQNTWLQARERFFTGYAIGGDELWNGIAGLGGIDNSAALNVARFFDCFERLLHWRRQLQGSATANSWVDTLNLLLNDFFSETDSTGNYLQEIRDCIDTLHFAGDSKLSVRLIRHWLESQLNRQQRQGGLFSGGVTFCGMRPMRNLPHQIICLLGMNDAAFPRRMPHYDFDILNRHYRPGDPSNIDEDRYLMLETLLCARQCLYISYTGKSLSDNSDCQPSVLVSELVDFIDSQPNNEDNRQKLSDELIQLHPMQVFSAGNFTSPLFSYDESWCNAAKLIQSPRRRQADIDWPPEIPAPDIQNISNVALRDLKRFLPHPLKYFFNTRLKIFFELESEQADEENFTADGLIGWQIRTRLADYILKGQGNYQGRLDAEGLLPHGSAGTAAFNSLEQQNENWLHELTGYAGLSKKSIAVNIDLGTDNTLTGDIGFYYPGKGLMHHSASRTNGANLLGLWIDHLCLSTCNKLSPGEFSYLVAADQTSVYDAIEATQALDYLADLCLLFSEGQSKLLPIFPKSSFAFALEPGPEKAAREALNAWYSSPHSPVKGDEDDAYVQLALRYGRQFPLDLPEFADYASRLYRAALDHRMDP